MTTTSTIEPSFELTRSFLGGVAAFQAIAAVGATLNSRPVAAKANAIGTLVCLIAWQIYGRMKGSNQDLSTDSLLRHIDWTVTCPLMLWEFFVLLRIPLITDWPYLVICMICICVSIALGKRATNPNEKHKSLLFSVATILFAIMLLIIVQRTPNFDKSTILPFSFLAVWILYPIAFWLPRPAPFYNTLDAISKGLFGLLTAVKAF